jgi:tetratricopeptide (TPR) repeat protein
MEKSSALIQQLKSEVPNEKNPAEEQIMQVKLALAYLSAYQFDQATTLLIPLQESELPEIKKRAKFYLAWIYKIRTQYDQSTSAFLDLLNDPDVEKDMQLGLQAELADLYYQKGDVEKSLKQYKNVSEIAAKEAGPETKDLSKEALREVWLALSELERAKIYHYNFDATGGMDQLGRRLSELDAEYSQTDNLKDTLEKISDIGLREQAFYHLENGRVQIALELFTKDAVRHPRDSWTLGGLAIVYILLGDMDKAEELAKQAYQLGPDYYTASVMGYLNALRERYDEAENYYIESLGTKPDYLPARFNLASVYLKSEKYQQGLGLLARLERDLGNSQKLIRAKIINNIGYAYWYLGDKDKARDNFKQAIALEPGFSVARNNLSQVTAGEAPRMVNLRE